MLNSLPKIKYSLRSWIRRNLIKIKSLDELYENIQKLTTISQKTVYTPELENIPIDKNNLKRINTEEFQTPEIYTVTLSNVIYYPEYEVIGTYSRQLIAESIRSSNNVNRFSLLTLLGKRAKKISGVCSVFRCNPGYKKNYYHSLIDNFSRIYLLEQEKYKNISEIKLLVAGELSDMEKFFLPKIIPQNVTLNLLDPENIYSIEELIFPTYLTSLKCGYLPKSYIDYFLEKVAPKRKRKKVNRLLICRKVTGKGRYILNEQELWQVLKQYGFSRYYLEDLPFEQQIELFYDAEIVIGAHGAGLANLIFSENARILELFPNDKIVTFYYFLSKAVGNKHNWLCHAQKNMNANFSVDIQKVTDWLKSLVNSPIY